MQQPSVATRPRPRIETLADLIFGLSLSIGSIALIANPPKSNAEITAHILAFAYTFFVLITAWMIYTTYMSVLSTKNVYANASMWAVISALLFGGFAIRAIEPIESESPKMRSASVSIRGRGRVATLGCCIDRTQEIVAIWSF